MSHFNDKEHPMNEREELSQPDVVSFEQDELLVDVVFTDSTSM